MFRELLQFLKGNDHGQALAGNLDRMIQESGELIRIAGDVYFHRASETPGYQDVKARDKGINRLQQQIRKEAFEEALAESRRFNLPFCLSLMNIVKDLERLGDYAKDLAELEEIAGPATESEFNALAVQVEELVDGLSTTMEEADQVKAVEMIDQGKKIRRKLSSIQRRLLTEDATLPRSPAETLALHYYIRIVSHTLNVLSTLVTPLHRMDSLNKKHLLPEVKEKLQARDS